VPDAAVSVNSPGTYFFRWTIASTGCSNSINDVKIVFTAPPPVANAGADKNVCALSTAMTANAVGSGNTGAWLKISGPGIATFSSATSPTATASVTVAGTYVFSWTISKNACTTSDEVEVIYNDACLLGATAVSSGIVTEEPAFSREDGTKLYPNPAANVFTVELPEEGPVEVQLSTLTGLLVKTAASTQRTVTMGVSDVANGIYIVYVRQYNRIVRKKVKVMH
jgi:hypothetical protein